jgi:hypothetical protein
MENNVKQFNSPKLSANNHSRHTYLVLEASNSAAGSPQAAQSQQDQESLSIRHKSELFFIASDA